MAKKKTARKTSRSATSKSKASKSQRSGRKPRWSVVSYDEIEAWRKEHKLPKKRMAMLLGVTNSTYHNWARGISIATYNTQRKIKEILDRGEVPGHVMPPARGSGRKGSGPLSSQRMQELSLATDLVKAYVEANPGKVSPDGLVDLIGQVREQLRS